MRSHRDGDSAWESWTALAGEADRSCERHQRAARKLAGQTTPADTTIIITGNF
jgi:hypothetical protein